VKNIVLLITDTFRYDNLREKAERPVRTPELNRFAAERATSVERVYMGSFPTIPHRTDLGSGILGWPHYGWQPIEVSGPNHIGTILGKAGYATQLICDCPHLFHARFQYGFNAAFQHRGQEGDRYLLHLNDPIQTAVPIEKTRYRSLFREHTLVDCHRWMNRYYQFEAQTFPARTAETVIRWLEENYKANPFFLWVDFFDPHEPWDPPEYIVRRYDPDYTGTPMLHCNYGPASDYTPEELKNLWAHYAAESELVDRYIGRVLQKMDDLQLWDDTIVLVTSDHGTSLGEHNRTGKSNIHPTDQRYWPIYPEIGQVPFLIAGGDVQHGKSLDLMAQPIDILPTLCELAGAPIAPPKKIEGKSFAQAILKGKVGGKMHREYAVSGCHIKAEPGARPRKAVTPFLVTKQWGYAPVGAYGRPELYDLRKDPLAKRDLAKDHRKTVSELHDLFLSHLAEHGASESCLALWKSAKEGEGTWAVDYPDKTT
jgi:arylsulfatase A-like enzyme